MTPARGSRIPLGPPSEAREIFLLLLLAIRDPGSRPLARPFSTAACQAFCQASAKNAEGRGRERSDEPLWPSPPRVVVRADKAPGVVMLRIKFPDARQYRG
jgi:hypothetical protein